VAWEAVRCHCYRSPITAYRAMYYAGETPDVAVSPKEQASPPISQVISTA
jgi:hypothetical protein